MSDDDFISGSIKSVLINGIDLFLESPEEEEFYAEKMFEHFEAKTEFQAYLRKGALVEIENSDMQIAVELLISNSTLFFVPYVGDDVFEIFTEVLKFIAYQHQKIITEFRGIEETKIQSIKDLHKVTDEKTDEKEIEEESSSDDDYEWI